MYTKRARAEETNPEAKQRSPHSMPALASQHGAAIALAEASRGKPLSSALEANFTRSLASDIRIESLISADLQRLQAAAAGSIDALQTMNPYREAGRERWKRLLELPNPCNGVLEGLRMQSIRFDSTSLMGTELPRRMAEACSPRIAPIEIGLGLNAIAALGSVGNLAAVDALTDLHTPVRIHAVPRLPLPSASRPGRCREAFPYRSPLSPVPEAPSHPDPTGWLEGVLDDEGGRRVPEQLSRFVPSEEIPNDARDGMDFLLVLRKLKKTDLSNTERHGLLLTVMDFLRQQIGVLLPAGGLQQLVNGLLVPHPHDKTPVPDLAPEIFTTQVLAKKLPSTTHTLKRHAKKACENGPLPQSMPAFPGWFVVSQSDPKGGRGRGSKFRRQRIESQGN